MPVNSAAIDGGEQLPNQDEVTFNAILDVLCERSGADFRLYRVATLRRRVLNRMISARTRTFHEYLRLLKEDANEVAHLLNRVTIKVSRFYRNKATFDALRNDVIPELLACSDSPLRILSAGCGQGEEPYTLAMLLEELGAPGTIDAFDIDPLALLAAAKGRYDAAAFDELPVDLRERYLEPVEGGFSVCESVRRRVVFSRKDVTALRTHDDAGVPYDLLCCRNVLIYFEREVQARTLVALCRDIRPGGFLCLGEAEWPIPAVAAGLEALPHRIRIFRLHRKPQC
jgi:chemotaxis methyl-accepting protein methylase